MAIRGEQALSNVTLNSSGTGPWIANDGRSVWSLFVILGTANGTPSVTFRVEVSPDQVNVATAGPALSALTASGSQRTVYAVGSTQGPITEPFLRIAWTWNAGTSFSNSTAALFGI